MNLELFKKSDPSGRMSKESYLIKNFKDEYEFIIKYNEINNITDIPFKEKVYLCVNNIKTLPICKNSKCNNRVKFKNSTIGYREYCSTKCISSDPIIKKTKEEKSFEKWGTKTPAESKYIKDKIKKTNNERYGGNSPMSSRQIQDKSKKTLIKNWGVDNASKSKDILRKRIESFKLSNYKETYKETSLKRYGVEHPWMNKEIHKKSSIGTFISKNSNLEKSILDRLEIYKEYNLISIDYDKFKRNININCKTCNNIFTINREDFQIRFKNKTTICTHCNPINSSQSGTEMELYKFIKENYKGEIIKNSKRIVPPMELDIYLPELKLAFEFNGLYWHSESKKSKYYHFNKTKKCEDIGICLIHIWEDDWIFENEIIKSIIINKLKETKNKIFARKCKISEISDTKLVKFFLDSNHILGTCPSNIKMGLYYNDELVSLMCFRKINKDSYELVRFCNKINTVVIGGSSKLFGNFLKNNDNVNVISYSDDSMFSGNLYKKLGFDLIGNSRINYKWVIGKKRQHKSNYRKDRLVKSGFDKSKSENDIMVDDVGSYKVWDCGLKKWEYKSEKK